MVVAPTETLNTELEVDPLVDPYSNGAISVDDFSLGTGARSVNFWMKMDPNYDVWDYYPTMISLGAEPDAGARFDVRLNGGYLRLEVQSGGYTTDVPVWDGNWYNVTVTCQDGATVSDCSYYVFDSSGTLLANDNFVHTRAINTADGPLRIGDSFHDTWRDFSGYLDDVRLYNNFLTVEEVAAMVPEPSTFALAGLGLAGLVMFRKRKV